MTTYVMAGGCFWCIDAVYRQLKGVLTVESGYANGQDVPTNYYRVASGRTGHAEAVKVVFDEQAIPADIILDLFFLIHDPTTLNRQGADVGTQYRSSLMYADEQQRQEYEAARTRAQRHWENPIVTEIVPLENFQAAEPEHQDFFNKQPASGYCSIVIVPKIVKARQKYQSWFKEETYATDEV
jgi:peptide-methionine (S)-S-oxide reductase